MVKRLHALLKLFGFDGVRLGAAFWGVPRYLGMRSLFLRTKSSSHAIFPCGKMVPCLGDDNAESGCGHGAYFYQDLWAAQQVYRHAPQHHVDVGSRVDGFVAHVAAFRELDVIDIRPLAQNIPGVHFRRADVMNELPAELVACCDSLSCLHALEHFGLGRYGDPLDPDGWRKGFDNLCRMLKSGGRLYLSVPIGPSRVEFNSQRVFAVAHMVGLLAENFNLEELAVIDDRGFLRTGIDWCGSDAERSFDCQCGCGVFVARKR